ncbi:MAG: ribonuclease HI family protein [Methanomassiliicoccales archaeon]
MRVYSDGGARGNPGPAAFAYLICSEDGRVLKESEAYIGSATNNEAEYRGLISALSQAKTMGADEITITMDSELIVKQMRGEYRIKAENLVPLAEEARWRLSEFKSVSITHAKRNDSMISRTDLLVNEELDRQDLLRKLR